MGCTLWRARCSSTPLRVIFSFFLTGGGTASRFCIGIATASRSGPSAWKKARMRCRSPKARPPGDQLRRVGCAAERHRFDSGQTPQAIPQESRINIGRGCILCLANRGFGRRISSRCRSIPRHFHAIQRHCTRSLWIWTAQLDRTERLLRQLLQAKSGHKSEQLLREQLALFAQEPASRFPRRLLQRTRTTIR